MIRLYAVVEGSSEERFLQSVLTPHLLNFAVYLQPMQVLRGGGVRGGGQSWQPWHRHLQKLLGEHKGGETRFTTMLDLYAIPKDTPGWTPPGSQPHGSRANAIIEALGENLPDYRFLPYVQVHEFETFIFVDPDELARQAPDIIDAKGLERLKADVAGLEPEDVNAGRETAPSKRVEACTHGFRKLIHGLQAIQAIGLPQLRKKCPRFNAWVSSLEQFGEY